MPSNQENTRHFDDIVIPNFKEFSDILHDRLHAILYHIEELKGNFTLITNLRDRSPKFINDVVLVYAGAEVQRRILEKKSQNLKHLDKHWKYLNEFQYRESRKDEFREFITYDIFQQFKKGGVSINNINVGSLAPYFRRISNPIQGHEYAVLRNHFNYNSNEADFFITLPIISLARFEGVVHIIFKKEDLLYFIDKEQYEINKVYNDKINQRENIYDKLEWLEKELDDLQIKINPIEEQKETIRVKIKELEHELKIIEHYERIEVLDKKLNFYLKTYDKLNQEIAKLNSQLKAQYPAKTEVIKRLIKLFTIEYDSLLLDWDLVGPNVQLSSQIKYDRLTFIDSEKENPIFKEVGLPTYYRISRQYFEQRIQQHNLIPQKLIQQQRLTAIITILVDSYAHNISAHSLTALNWWFRERALWLGEKKKWDTRKGSQREFRDLLKKYSKNPLAVYGGNHLTPELHPFLKFLMEKGAFWSGITRKTNFGGLRTNWYHMLWFDFVNSPLYLGTIANSEGVNRINLHIVVYDTDETIDKFRRKRVVLNNKKGKPLSGHFVTIDLWQEGAYKDNPQIVKKLRNKYEELKEASVFVSFGDEFEILRDYLIKANVFLSGGLVGKHALFTMIENEIRNVKHFTGDMLDNISYNGLDLYISLQSLSVKGRKHNNSKKEIYQVGIWLNHVQDLRLGVEKEDNLVLLKMRGLVGDVIEIQGEEYKPRLGGNFQDKICAGMLFNNDFGKVQSRETARDRAFYPWMVVGTASKDDVHLDFELNPHNTGLFADTYREILNEDEIKAAFLHEKGYIKKYFYMWKGAEIYEVSAKEKFDWENISRFRFVHVVPNLQEQYEATRQQGAIRILRDEVPKKPIEAYQLWLGGWRKTQDDCVIDFIEGKTFVGSIICQNNELAFLNYETARSRDNPLKEQRLKIKNSGNHRKIEMAHGGKEQDRTDVWGFRTHGTVIREIFNIKTSISQVKKIEPLLLYELFEALITRICIFDNRVYERLKDEKRDFYRKNLLLDVRKERSEEWTKSKLEGFINLHFLVVHLSFIEDLYGKKYNETNITDFVGTEILGGKSIKDLEHNFSLVITTGRGRTEWWLNLSRSEYTRFTTFRPIESILSGIEDALQKNDDFDLKFNIVKVLFGS